MIPSGLMVRKEYFDLLNSEIFKHLESYNNSFLEKNRKNLETYNSKWTFDSFHQWSRQWEYPYFFEKIQNYIKNNPGKKIRILDAGSGITYFSYLLKSENPNIEITCIDYDSILPKAYDLVNKTMGMEISFRPMDLRNIDFPSESFDLIYCVSVLEHTNNFEAILENFNRVLSKDGQLVLSFDISVENDFDIPVEKAKVLLQAISRNFKPIAENNYKLSSLESINDHDVLTTLDFRKIDKKLLPWRKPYKNAIRLLMNFKKPKFTYNLACYCDTYEKRT